MQAFTYHRADDIEQAIAAAAVPGTKFLAGGTNLLDLMKGRVERPSRLVDIQRLPLAQVSELGTGGVSIGAMVSNSAAANHPLIRQGFPLLSRALLAGASPQLRNMASVGGNLVQRTRCHYFYDIAFANCNKRAPGTGCAAREGSNRMHALFGASDHCVATHPSDMAVALAALDATVVVRGPHGDRRIAIGEFHRLPGTTPDIDNDLASGELIMAVELPPSPFARHWHYLKIRDRASYAFAVVAVAAALELDDGMIRDARIVLGGVAHKPWRVIAAERELIGRRPGAAPIAAAARASIAGAQPLPGNAFKVELTQRAVQRAVQLAGGLA